MPESSADDRGFVQLGRDIADAVKRLAVLEFELIKAQARALVLRVGVGLSLVTASIVTLQLFLVFLIGTAAQARDFDDNHIAAVSGLALLLAVLFAPLATVRWRKFFAGGAAVFTAVALVGAIAFLIVAVFFTDHVDARRSWGIASLSLLGMTLVFLASGALLIKRAVSGGKETAADVKKDVSSTVEDVMSRRWRG